jgi:hypothetical protein
MPHGTTSHRDRRTGRAFGQGDQVPDPVMNEPAKNELVKNELVMNDPHRQRALNQTNPS